MPGSTQGSRTVQKINQYLEIERLRVFPKTHVQHRQFLQRYNRWLVGNGCSVEDVTKDLLIKYLQTLNHVVPRHYNDILRVIRQFYIWLAVEPNPAESIPNKLHKPRKLPRIPAKVSLQRAINNIKGINAKTILRNQLICELAWGSGLRRAEIVGLDIDDIDMSEQTAIVTGKGSKQRVVPLTSKSIELMREYLSARGGFHGALILSTRGINKRLQLEHVSKIVREKTGLTTHRFRHACATHMLQNGCDLRSLQILLGHAELTMTAWYAQTSKKGIAKVLNKTHPRANNL